MKRYLWPVQAFQFPQQFKFDVWHKQGKKQIISDTLSQFANANTWHPDSQYSELNVLLTYNIMLVKIYPALIS